ncbi:MAG TPA: ferritin-like protein [Reyranella sp.]|nr:ferritin-like protein [Reyranella sp.]
MRTLAQFVNDGISDVPTLQAALQTALQLEFSTIPPYLCAQWSIAGSDSDDDNSANDPSGVADMIQDIVVQEMSHFALAGNMLAAIKGTPRVTDAGFVVGYPTNKLPGDIYQALAVDLQPLSTDQLKVFMQIELPEFPPLELALQLVPPPTTIGQFYTTLSAAFMAINPPFDANARQIVYDEATAITNVQDAVAAIAKIKSEGEGTQTSPDQASGQPAHYYMFREILRGKAADGSVIQMPKVLPFAPSSAQPDPSAAFNATLRQLLASIQACWDSGAALSLSGMRQLKRQGTALIKSGIRPAFQP